MKADVMKKRLPQPSHSPDKYHLNGGMVVQLAEPIRKPSDIKPKMYSTGYKGAQKGGFFPSTATATTNGSSGNGSSDPRRTTDGNRDRKGNGNYNQNFELNLPLRFGQGQVKRPQPGQPRLSIGEQPPVS